MTGIPAFSVVVPCYNEAASLQALAERVTTAAASVFGDSFEVLLVNDGSTDNSWELMSELARKDSRIGAINLSRNHGHQLALSAGLSLARGELLLTIDADLQHPPELISGMKQLIDTGADVVYGVRKSRPGEKALKRVSGPTFYRMLSRLSDTAIPPEAADFRMMTRRVVDVLLDMPEQHRFLRGMIPWIGFTQVPIAYDQPPRAAGKSHYSPARMIALALDGMTGFSVAPLRLSIYFSLLFFLLSVAIGIYAVVIWATRSTVPGWTSILVAVTMFSSVQLLVLAILGEYVGRTYIEAKRRPLFVIKEVIGRRGPK